MTRSRIVDGAIGLISAFGLAGCEAKTSTPPPSPAVAEVRIVPNPVKLVAGGGVQLAAEVDDKDGQPIGRAKIGFLSGDPSKLEVTSTGFLQSVGPSGQAEIVASSGDKQTRVPVQITAGPPRTLQVIGGDGQTAVVGTALPRPLVVRAVDGENNPVVGSELSFVPADGGAAEPHASATDSSGLASVSWKLGPRAGTQTLTASVEATHKPATTFSAHAESGAPQKLSGWSEPATEASGQVGHVLMVRVTDANDNPKAGVTIHWRVEKGGGALSSDTSVSDQSGVARVLISPTKGTRRQRVAAHTGDVVTFVEVAAK